MTSSSSSASSARTLTYGLVAHSCKTKNRLIILNHKKMDKKLSSSDPEFGTVLASLASKHSHFVMGGEVFWFDKTPVMFNQMIPALINPGSKIDKLGIIVNNISLENLNQIIRFLQREPSRIKNISFWSSPDILKLDDEQLAKVCEVLEHAKELNQLRIKYMSDSMADQIVNALHHDHRHKKHEKDYSHLGKVFLLSSKGGSQVACYWDSLVLFKVREKQPEDELIETRSHKKQKSELSELAAGEEILNSVIAEMSGGTVNTATTTAMATVAERPSSPPRRQLEGHVPPSRSALPSDESKGEDAITLPPSPPRRQLGLAATFFAEMFPRGSVPSLPPSGTATASTVPPTTHSAAPTESAVRPPSVYGSSSSTLLATTRYSEAEMERYTAATATSARPVRESKNA